LDINGDWSHIRHKKIYLDDTDRIKFLETLRLKKEMTADKKLSKLMEELDSYFKA
jgi:hypothetical protein